MTTTATAKTQTLQLQVNVPVDMEIRYIDVWPNDPSKDTKNHKGFGASVALKGIVRGEEVRVYPKGFVNRTIEKLVNYGVIEDGHYQHDPAEKYSIPVKNGQVRIVNAQPAGERYANFDILSVNGNDAASKAPPPKPAVMASKPNAELPPLLQNQEVEDAAELQAKVGIDLTKFSKDLALYTALTEFVTEKIAPIYADNSVGIGMSPESAVAAVATLYIQAKRTANEWPPSVAYTDAAEQRGLEGQRW